MSDDRADFARQRAQHLQALAADDVVWSHNREIITRSDELGYSYVWDWLGLPIIQMPTDVLALQEIVWERRPDVVVETGVARGGSLVLYASLLRLLGRPGRVIGVDVDIRPHNRDAITQHPLAADIHLVEGSSVTPATLAAVRELLRPDDRVMVVLDSDHTHAHVLSELGCYAELVSPGQALVVADTVVEELPLQTHRPRAWGPGNNPMTAVDEFLAQRSDFARIEDTNAKLLMSSSRGGYLWRCS